MQSIGIWSLLGFLLLSLLSIAHNVGAAKDKNACPHSCVCRRQTVKCYQLTKFPWSFPNDTQEVLFDEMNIFEVPPNGFRGLNLLTKIEFSRCNFGALSTCSFTNAPNLTSIILKSTVIGSISKGAFQQVPKQIEVRFISCRITEFKAYAFLQTEEFSTIDIYDSNIYGLNSNSFFNISKIDKFSIDNCTFGFVDKKAINTNGVIGKFELLGSLFGELACQSIEDPLSASTIDIQDNVFNCSCASYWLKPAIDRAEIAESFKTSHCVKSGSPEKIPLMGELRSATAPCDDQRKQELTECSKKKDVAMQPFKCPVRLKGKKYRLRRRRRYNSSQSIYTQSHGTLFAILFVILFAYI